MEAFIDEWLARPMFAGLAQRDLAWRDADRAQRLGHEAARLAVTTAITAPAPYSINTKLALHTGTVSPLIG
mgnify:CR=1 FL=1